MSMKTSHVAFIAAVLLGLIVSESLPLILASNHEGGAGNIGEDREAWHTTHVAGAMSHEAGAAEPDKLDEMAIDEMEAVWAPIDFGDQESLEPYRRGDGPTEPFWMTSAR